LFSNKIKNFVHTIFELGDPKLDEFSKVGSQYLPELQSERGETWRYTKSPTGCVNLEI